MRQPRLAALVDSLLRSRAIAAGFIAVLLACAGGCSAGTAEHGVTGDGGGGVTGGGGTVGTGGSTSTGGNAGAGDANGSGGISTGAGGGGGSGGKAGSGGIATGAGGSNGSGGTGTCAATFKNPVIWEDLADAEVIRVDNTYYYTASTMHYSPGAPILRSHDLVNWEFIGHSVPVLDYASSYDLNGGRAYVNGIWASSLQYRKSNKTFYWIGCMHNVGGGYVYTATNPEGPWTKHKHTNCYYDVGMLIDDDDTMYVAYGNTTISVAQLSADGFSQVKSQAVFTTPSGVGPLEGSRMYKINGTYYIFPTQYANGEYVLKSSGGPFGPYTLKQFAVHVPTPVSGAGYPHQGSLVQTAKGNWYYMSFLDAYPGGRIPALAPVTWSADGWPSVTLVNGGWGATYPFPDVPCSAATVKPLTGTDTFSTATLGPEWEWNHNPDNTKWSAGSGLTLQTATVTNDIYMARNTLTHRILGPTSTGTIELDYSNMKDGDIAGLALFRDQSAWIGIKKSGGSTKVAMVNNLVLDSANSWATKSTGTEVAATGVSGGKIWLRLSVDIHPGSGKQGKFYYSTDGSTFTQLGTAFTMTNDWQFFMGYRFGIFNYATSSLGGSVKIRSFALAQP